VNEPVSLMKGFRLLTLERNFFGVQSVDTVDRCNNILSIGRASVIFDFLKKKGDENRVNHEFLVHVSKNQIR